MSARYKKFDGTSPTWWCVLKNVVRPRKSMSLFQI
ncbi:hypothetical protein VTL71DRAFT_3000 [Oculimacula yallundae]|uniref:Uncharacterized protein n=1 Tax=Oculimacula yallundae TaxID=86028 RepID=A0ABR4C713_9HELO